MDGYDAREQAGHEPYGPHDGSSPPSSQVSRCVVRDTSWPRRVCVQELPALRAYTPADSNVGTGATEAATAQVLSVAHNCSRAYGCLLVLRVGHV